MKDVAKIVFCLKTGYACKKESLRLTIDKQSIGESWG